MNISVIIPVYNTREYLAPCLESVLAQTLKDIEILVVDDGSDDGSWEVIRKYQDTYNNIHAFRQQRKRQGAARNVALKHASGEFIAFLDSDDTVPPTAYEKMYEAAQRNATDLVVGIQRSFRGIWHWVGVPVHRKHFKNTVNRTSISDFPELLQDISACNKLFRRSKLKGTAILFPEQISGEDLYFTARVFLEFDRVSVLPEVVYNYRARPNASTGRIKPSFFRDRVLTTQQLDEVYNASGKSAVFQYLLRSELRKLMGNRFTKVIEGSPQSEKNEVINTLHSLSTLVDEELLVGATDVAAREKIKIFLLKNNELQALFSFVGHEKSDIFLDAIKQRQHLAFLQAQWMDFKSERGNPISLSSLQGYKRQIKRATGQIKKSFRKKILSVSSYYQSVGHG